MIRFARRLVLQCWKQGSKASLEQEVGKTFKKITKKNLRSQKPWKNKNWNRAMIFFAAVSLSSEIFCQPAWQDENQTWKLDRMNRNSSWTVGIGLTKEKNAFVRILTTRRRRQNWLDFFILFRDGRARNLVELIDFCRFGMQGPFPQ